MNPRDDLLDQFLQIASEHHREQGYAPIASRKAPDPLVCPECGAERLLLGERHARCCACDARLVVLR